MAYQKYEKIIEAIHKCENNITQYGEICRLLCLPCKRVIDIGQCPLIIEILKEEKKMISTECAKCIHNEVCGLKTCVKEAEAKVTENKIGCIHQDVEIAIKCRKFKDGSNPLTYSNGVRLAEL